MSSEKSITDVERISCCICSPNESIKPFPVLVLGAKENVPTEEVSSSPSNTSPRLKTKGRISVFSAIKRDVIVPRSYHVLPLQWLQNWRGRQRVSGRSSVLLRALPSRAFLRLLSGELEISNKRLQNGTKEPPEKAKKENKGKKGSERKRREGLRESGTWQYCTQH